MAEQFDVIVIGTGMAGSAAADRMARAGKRVAIVDSRPYGGTCALRGCDPKKVLVGAAEIIDWQRRMNGLGIAGDLRIDWDALMRFKRTFTDPVPDSTRKHLEHVGVTTYSGGAVFKDPNTVVAGNETLHAENILIASGSQPAPLTFPGAEHVATSTDFLNLESLPARIVFIGGGYVSFEFAHIAARAGAKVEIVHRGARPLRNFEPILVDRMVEAGKRVGVAVETGSEITEVRTGGRELRVYTSTGRVIPADLVIHGAGRIPEIGQLNLSDAGIDFDPAKGIIVNEHLQSVSNGAVYAAGDAAATEGWPLTPVAVHEAFIATSNIMNGNTKTPDYLGTPSVVFTIPNIARAGMTEREAKDDGLDFMISEGDMNNWYSSRRTNETATYYRILLDKATGTIIGAHLLGAHAGEVINMFSLAIRNRVPSRALKTGIFVHPAATTDVAYMM